MRTISVALALSGLLTWQAATAAAQPTPTEFARYAEARLADAYRADGPGAAVLVIRGDEVLYRGARGRADVAAGIPLKPSDRFRIASVTKQLSAVGLLTLVDAGKISLDDPLSEYLPTYPGGEGITIEQLLNHTSGIKDYTAIPGTFEGPIRRHVTTEQLVDYFKNEAVDFAPGERWGYSNSGYVLVGAVIEAVSSQPWHVYLKQALFEPIGMNDTGYGAETAVVSRQVKGYVTSRGFPTFPLQLSMTQPHAAGALVSTVDDLARWSRALHGGQVLEPETYARMITPVGEAKTFDSGYGVFTSTVRSSPALWHDGAIAGFGSYLLHVPDAKVTVVVLNNDETPSRAHGPVTVARHLAAAAMGDPYPPVTPVPVHTATLRQYEGVYRVDQDAVRTLRVVDGHLTAVRTRGFRETLTAISIDTFVYPDGLTRLKLLRDATGTLTGMRFWSNGEGEGVVAPRTDLAVPIDFGLPRDAFGRLVGRYWVPVLLIGATIALFYAATRWRRRKRLFNKKTPV